MVLYGFSILETIKGFLWVTLIILILVILYRRLLRYLGKGRVSQDDYCVLYGLEEQPSSGEIEFYFTSAKPKYYQLLILDEDMNKVHEVISKECHVGGNIVRFNSNQLENGIYFYCLKTDNQKTVKKMQIKN